MKIYHALFFSEEWAAGSTPSVSVYSFLTMADRDAWLEANTPDPSCSNWFELAESEIKAGLLVIAGQAISGLRLADVPMNDWQFDYSVLKAVQDASLDDPDIVFDVDIEQAESTLLSLVKISQQDDSKRS